MTHTYDSYCSTLVQNENNRLDERKRLGTESRATFRDRMNTDPLPSRPQKNAPSSSPAEKPVYPVLVGEGAKKSEKNSHEMRELRGSSYAYSGYE